MGIGGQLMHGAQGYRADIDGLRALAVLPVVAFHLGFRPVAGGYVGVDVFFVISGYLIGRIVLSETREGTFSLRRFYARRVRRIFPALFAMFAATTVAAYIVLYPSYLLDYAKSMAAAALSASNFYFWATADYFDAPVEAKPLLHTWSLAVEEQFYIFLPLAALALARANLALQKMAFGLVFLASFAWATYAVSSGHASDGFYLPHLRAWELLLGVLAALGLWPTLRAAWMRHAAALIGLPLIVGPIFLYHADTPFPGLSAAAPCIGAALLIAAGEQGDHLFSKMLRFGPIAFLGLISYSLYLWHWPIITLYQQYSGDIDISWPTKIALGAASILVSAASWRWIERPFRRAVPDPGPALFTGGAAIGLTAAASIALIAAHGLPSRFSPEITRIAAYLDLTPRRAGGACLLSGASRHALADLNDARCARLEPNVRNVLILGDSHAHLLVSGLRSNWPHINFMQATVARCLPLLPQETEGAPGCRAVVDYAINTLAPDRRIDLIVIAGRWTMGDENRFSRTLEALSPYRDRTLVVGPTVRYDGDVPRLIIQEIRSGQSGLADRHVAPGLAELDRHLEAAARERHFAYVSAYRVFCPNDDCVQMSASGAPYQFDYGHLTDEGSDYLTAILFAPALNAPPFSGAPQSPHRP